LSLIPPDAVAITLRRKCAAIIKYSCAITPLIHAPRKGNVRVVYSGRNGGGKHETHDPIDRLISEWFTTAQQAQAKLDEETVKAQARAWFRADPAEYVSEVYLPYN
jgi:hypothetical protein